MKRIEIRIKVLPYPVGVGDVSRLLRNIDTDLRAQGFKSLNYFHHLDRVITFTS